MWGLFLVLLHTLPGKVFPSIPTIFDLLAPDKFVHVVMFGVFFILMTAGFRNEGNPGFFANHPVIAAFLCAFLFGVAMELTQNYLIPNRFGSVFDLIANTVGCFAGWGLWEIFTKITTKARRHN